MAEGNTTVHDVAAGSRRRGRTVAVLEVLEGAEAGQTFDVSEPALIIGKAEDAQIRLTDTGVSRSHAKVVLNRDGGINLLDLASTNGTFVNDAKIDLAVLREGDRVKIGPKALLRLTHRPIAAKPGARAGEVSERQLEVARLVASGLTNAAIGEKLSISPRTVTSHLDHIYNRLGIGSRAALTRWVIEGGFLET